MEKEKSNRQKLLLIILLIFTVCNALLCIFVIFQKQREQKAIMALNQSIERYRQQQQDPDAAKDSGGAENTDGTGSAGGTGNADGTGSADGAENTDGTGGAGSEKEGELMQDMDFYYEPLSDELKKRITGLSFRENDRITYDDLRHVVVKYIDFDWNVREGELIVNEKVAKEVVDIFRELYNHKYPIEKIRLVDDYQADDEASMEDNNTSAFNYRVIDGTDMISDHGYGVAIDINPRYNPYVRNGFGDRDVLPVNGAEYADRSKKFDHKIEKGDVCYQAFISRGWKWGGEWEDPVDYQHFYKEIS